jgi:hypothetical protein
VLAAPAASRGNQRTTRAYSPQVETDHPAFPAQGEIMIHIEL